MRIYITSVPVGNYRKALTFYTDVLGFKKKQDIQIGHGMRYITLVSPEDPDGPEMMLEPNARYPAMKALREALMADGIPITAFAVDDVGQEYQRLLAKGVKFTQPPAMEGGTLTAVFDDTNGNLIQIVEVRR